MTKNTNMNQNCIEWVCAYPWLFKNIETMFFCRHSIELNINGVKGYHSGYFTNAELIHLSKVALASTREARTIFRPIVLRPETPLKWNNVSRCDQKNNFCHFVILGVERWPVKQSSLLTTLCSTSNFFSYFLSFMTGK